MNKKPPYGRLFLYTKVREIKKINRRKIMKKSITKLLVTVLFAFAAFRAEAQMGALDGAMVALLEVTHLDQVAAYAQQLIQLVQSAENTYNQFQNMIRQEQMALKNLKGISNVKSWDDFKDWNNRQLYLERQAEGKFKNLGVSVGGKKYSFTEAEELAEAMKYQYVDYFDRDFTEDQRREMWVNLGMTPSNYKYMATWKEREKQLGHSIATKIETLSEEKKKSAERNKEIIDKIAADGSKSETDKMGEKELSSYQLEVAIDTNMAIRDMAIDNAEAREMDLMRQKQIDAPSSAPRLSDSYNRSDDFGELSED
jgi:hypothetical protein